MTDVSVTGMEDVGDPEVVPLTDLSDESEDMGQLGAGDDTILCAVGRSSWRCKTFSCPTMAIRSVTTRVVTFEPGRATGAEIMGVHAHGVFGSRNRLEVEPREFLFYRPARAAVSK
jgi:hypothetical protein